MEAYKTSEMEIWGGEFGKRYTDRNAYSFEEFENRYIEKYGINRTALNKEFLDGFNRNIRILEIGANVGYQLLCLQKMGFTELYGIELQNYAIEKSKILTKNIFISKGSIFDIPFKDNFFDLVYTSGVLIHIKPDDLKIAMDEIVRCSKKYIWGFEYFSEEIQEIPYRGHNSLMWKANYPEIFLNYNKDLSSIKQKKINYKNDNNIDIMYLLTK